MTARFIAVTIASKPYLSLARVTARSFHEHNPEIPFTLVLSDEMDGWFEIAKEPFSLLSVNEIGLRQLERIRFHYSPQEFSYAITPHVIDFLLAEGWDGVLFLKQETLVLDTLVPLCEALQRHSLMLTPHLLDPPRRSGALRRELDVLRAGVYNGGVVLVANRPESRRFLAWWKERTFSDCLCRVEEGLHYEQRWLDFAPSLVPGAHVIRDPGVNVGHWNLPERDIRVENGRVTANGEPCRIFRFSGYDPEHPERITKYYPDRRVDETGRAASVFERYNRMLMEAGYAETKMWPYAYGRFDNGAEVTEAHRSEYRWLGDQAVRFGDPLATSGGQSFWNSLEPALREDG